MQAFAATHLVGSDSGKDPRADSQCSKIRRTIRACQPTQQDNVPTQLALCVARETLAAANPNNMDSVFGPSAGVLAESLALWPIVIWSRS